MLLLTLPALAYDTIGAAWPASQLPIPYYISDDLGDLDDDAAVEAIQAAIAVWSDAECGIPFAYQGRISDTSFSDAADGRNVIYVVDSGWPDESALASSPRMYVDGTDITEGDIGLNAQYFSWSVEGADGLNTFDLTAGMVHEAGHLLGLWHSLVEGASLSPAMVGNPDAVTLEADDIEGLCYLYEDINSAGGGGIGDPCQEGDDCADGLECLTDLDGRYCSSTCSDEADCPDGYSCYAIITNEQYCAVEISDEGCGGCQATTPGGLVGLLLPLLLWARVRDGGGAPLRER